MKKRVHSERMLYDDSQATYYVLAAVIVGLLLLAIFAEPLYHADQLPYYTPR